MARPAVAAHLIAIGCLACSPSPIDQGGRPADDGDRWPNPSGPAPWDARGVHYWIAGCNVGEDLWKYRHDSTTVWCDERGRSFEGSQGQFDWPVYVAASEIDELILEGERLDSVELRFWWGQDESFELDRSVASAASSPNEVRFALAAVPAWVGEKERLLRLRLTWSGGPAPLSRLKFVRGERNERGRAVDGPPGVS